MDYYRVLGVPYNASGEEIKRAYRSLARVLHPDKAGSGSEQRMKEVNEAFHVLKDPQRRLMHDATRAAGIPPDAAAASHAGSPGFDWSDFVVRVVQCMSAMAATRHRGGSSDDSSKRTTTTKKAMDDVRDQQQQTNGSGSAEAAAVVRVSLSVTLQELFDPPVKKLSVRVSRFQGGGASAAPTVVTQNLYVSLMNYQDEYVFERMGDEVSPGVFGDIHVALQVEPHAVFNIDRLFSRYDLHITHTLSLAEYYYGARVALEQLDGTRLSVDYDGGGAAAGTTLNTSGRRCHIVHGAGLPYMDEETQELARGDLYVFFEVDLDGVDQAVLKDHATRSLLWALCCCSAKEKEERNEHTGEKRAAACM